MAIDTNYNSWILVALIAVLLVVVVVALLGRQLKEFALLILIEYCLVLGPVLHAFESLEIPIILTFLICAGTLVQASEDASRLISMVICILYLYVAVILVADPSLPAWLLGLVLPALAWRSLDCSGWRHYVLLHFAHRYQKNFK